MFKANLTDISNLALSDLFADNNSFRVSVILRRDTVVGNRLSCCWYVATKYCPFDIKFATCVHGSKQRVAFSMFEYIRTHFTLC